MNASGSYSNFTYSSLASNGLSNLTISTASIYQGFSYSAPSTFLVFNRCFKGNLFSRITCTYNNVDGDLSRCRPVFLFLPKKMFTKSGNVMSVNVPGGSADYIDSQVFHKMASRIQSDTYNGATDEGFSVNFSASNPRTLTIGTATMINTWNNVNPLGYTVSASDDWTVAMYNVSSGNTIIAITEIIGYA